MKFTYLMQPPRKYTFEMPKVKKWVIDHCEGLTLNLFAGIVLLDGIDEVRIDINPELKNIHCYMDAFEFVKNTDLKFNTIVLDPPYNLRKSREKYNGRYIGSFTKIKNEISRILLDKGTVITFGYSTVGMSAIRGFKKEEVLIICHSGDHNDTLAVIERKI